MKDHCSDADEKHGACMRPQKAPQYRSPIGPPCVLLYALLQISHMNAALCPGPRFLLNETWYSLSGHPLPTYCDFQLEGQRRRKCMGEGNNKTKG